MKYTLTVIFGSLSHIDDDNNIVYYSTRCHQLPSPFRIVLHERKHFPHTFEDPKGPFDDHPQTGLDKIKSWLPR